jgi:hypothetical protein
MIRGLLPILDTLLRKEKTFQLSTTNKDLGKLLISQLICKILQILQKLMIMILGDSIKIVTEQWLVLFKM